MAHAEFNGKNYVMASPAGSQIAHLWECIDGKATVATGNLTIVEMGKYANMGIKFIRYGAQKYFDDLNAEDYCVELKAFGFSSKEEAETFHNRLLEEFCKMPEAEHISCISNVTEERIMDVDS